MSLIVEDGTGISNADAYISQAEVTTYWTNRPTNSLATTWNAASSANKDSAIRVATAYLDAVYKWLGQVSSDTQALKWPRQCVFTERGTSLAGTVPQQVKVATAELAARALSEDLFPDVDSSNFIESEKVGPLEVRYRASAPARKQYTYISNLLTGLGYFKSGANFELLRG